MRGVFALLVSRLYLAILYASLPLLPVFAALVFGRPDFVLSYRKTLRKCWIHVQALQEGPALHYFKEVAGIAKNVPSSMQGECVQCGNCCMDHRCMFLEPIEGNRFACGIYSSSWRKYSNCGSFPLSQHDLDRYACPSYHVVPEQRIQFYPNANLNMNAARQSLAAHELAGAGFVATQR